MVIKTGKGENIKADEKKGFGQKKRRKKGKSIKDSAGVLFCTCGFEKVSAHAVDAQMR